MEVRSTLDARPLAPDPRATLRSLGLRPRKRLSQSFLADERVARAIVAAARLDPNADDVLEVGPGLGVLTRLLVRRARRVVAVELDEQLAEALPRTVPAQNLDVRQADVLKFDPAAEFAEPYVVVANLPYHITSPALRHLLAGADGIVPTRLVIMVQREVAERLAASPGQLSALTVATQVQAQVRILRRVPPTAFYPAPKVESAVLLLTPVAEEQRAITRDEVAAFTGFLHAGFAQPRKRLSNSLTQGLAWEKPEVTALLERVGVAPEHRPQELAVDDWVRLYRAYQTAVGAGAEPVRSAAQETRGGART